MKKWIEKRDKLDILVFNENTISNQYLAGINADFYMLYIDNTSYIEPPMNFYKLLNQRIPVRIDAILLTNANKYRIAQNLKKDRVIICYHENYIFDQGDINVFDNTTNFEYAKNNGYNNCVLIEKCVDSNYFVNNNKETDSKILCFDRCNNVSNIIEKSQYTIPPICGEMRLDLYNKHGAFLNIKDTIGYDVLEAMSCGMPVITSRKSVQIMGEDFIIHGVDGYIYNDISEVNSLPEIDKGLRKYIGDNARNKVINMSVEKFRNHWNSLLLAIKGV